MLLNQRVCVLMYSMYCMCDWILLNILTVKMLMINIKTNQTPSFPPQCHNAYSYPILCQHHPPRPRLYLALYELYFSQTTHSHRAQSRRQTRCTPQRYGAIGWLPRRCRRAPSLPPAPSAPAPSGAGYLEGRKGGRMGEKRIVTKYLGPFYQSSTITIRCYCIFSQSVVWILYLVIALMF